MFRRQLILALLLGGVAYLWWQSSQPSHYSEWTSDAQTDPGRALLDRPFAESSAVVIEFESPGDSVWRVSRVNDGLLRYRVQLLCKDSLLWRLYLDCDSDGVCRNYALLVEGKSIRVEPHGDSAHFLALGAERTEAWIPWSQDAVPYEAIPALCDVWSSVTERRLTIVRIQPQSEVVTQLPAVLKADSSGMLQLHAAGKELVTIAYESGQAARICLAGGRCLVRRGEPSS